MFQADCVFTENFNYQGAGISMITEITAKTLGKKKSGWRFDKRRELYVSYSIDTTFDGKRKVKRGFLTEKAAQEYIDQLKVQERLIRIGVSEPVKYPLVKELFEKRFADIENSAERLRAARVFKKFLKICGKDASVDKITKNHFKQFADQRLAELKSKSKDANRVESHKKTVNREINPLARAFSSVRDYYNLKWIKPEVYKFPVSSGGRTRLIEPFEYDRLLAYLLDSENTALPPEVGKARRRTGLILQFALMTGLRHGEICAIEKQKLNRARREVDVYRFKTKRWKIYSPIPDTMLYLMDEGAKVYPDGKYFFSERGKLQAGFYKQIKLACAVLEIPYGKFTDGGFILHDARHTFSTILHRNLIDDKTSVEFTDNPSAIGNYQHSSSESKNRAMLVIEKHFKSLSHKPDESRLDKLFDRIAAGEISRTEFKSEFKKSLESFYGFLARNEQSDVADVADVVNENFDFLQ